MQLEELKEIIQNEIGVLLYFSGENCNVCHALRPKFKEAFERYFPKIKQIYLDAHQNPKISAHFGVFTVPTIIVFLDGREFTKEGRNVSIYELINRLQRPYEIMNS